MEEKAIATKQETMPAVSSEALAACGVTSASDLSIAKIMLMQGQSEQVGAGNAKLGDIINTHTGAILGGFEQPIKIVPLKLVKLWRVDDMSNPKESRGKFLRHDPVTPKNEKLPWEDTENGIPIRRTMCMDFFSLLMSEIEANEAFPVAIRFKRTSTEAGRVISTVMAKNLYLRRPSFYRAVELGVEKRQKDGSWYAVFTVKAGDPLTPNELKQAEELFKLTATLTYNPDEGEMDDAPEQEFAPEVASAPQTVGDDGQGDMPF